MPNVVEVAGKYLPKAIDRAFVTESKSAIFDNGSKFIDLNFKEVGYVKVARILLDGLSDYYRANGSLTGENRSNQPLKDGYHIGNTKIIWDIYKLDYDRGKQFQIDYLDNEETMGQLIANVGDQFAREKVIPEKDTVVFSTIASKARASLGNLVTGKTIAENKIISEFNSAYEWLTEHEVPSEEQVIFVNPNVMTLIQSTQEVTKYLGQTDFTRGDITFKINTYNGRPIIEVPSSRFYTDVELFDGGYRPKSTSKLINYMVCSKKAVIPIVKIEKVQLIDREAVQDFDGYKLNIRISYGVIVPKNKVPGLYVSVSNTAATAKANTLAVDITKSGSSHVLNEYWSTPANLYGKIVHSTTAFTIGTDGSSSSEIHLGEPFTKLGASEYYAILGADGKVMACSGQVTLP